MVVNTNVRAWVESFAANVAKDSFHTRISRKGGVMSLARFMYDHHGRAVDVDC